METVELNRKLPYVKALRLEPLDPTHPNGKWVETKEVKAFPRKAWEKMFNQETHTPILPNFNWKFIESIPKPADGDELLPEVTEGKEITSVRVELERRKKEKEQEDERVKTELKSKAKEDDERKKDEREKADKLAAKLKTEEGNKNK